MNLCIKFLTLSRLNFYTHTHFLLIFYVKNFVKLMWAHVTSLNLYSQSIDDAIKYCHSVKNPSLYPCSILHQDNVQFLKLSAWNLVVGTGSNVPIFLPFTILSLLFFPPLFPFPVFSPHHSLDQPFFCRDAISLVLPSQQQDILTRQLT